MLNEIYYPYFNIYFLTKNSITKMLINKGKI